MYTSIYCTLHTPPYTHKMWFWFDYFRLVKRCSERFKNTNKKMFKSDIYVDKKSTRTDNGKCVHLRPEPTSTKSSTYIGTRNKKVYVKVRAANCLVFHLFRRSNTRWF